MQYTDTIAHVVDVAWIVMLAVWLVSAFSAKRNAVGTRGRWFVYRFGVLIVLYLIIRYSGLSATAFVNLYIHDPTIRWIGAALVVLGVALAIWARANLGRNWGMPMSEKEGAELVTTGPYAYVRNPIYSGVLLGLVGSSLALGIVWAIVLVLYGSYFFWSVFAEERIMLRLFPDMYPAYKARTKRLIPWVW